MASGGARARAGRPQDDNALRTDRRKKDVVVLPSEGRAGPPPEWPLSVASERELQLWEREWRRPQAVAWELNGQEIEVAFYVRAAVDAESPRAAVSARTLVRQQMDSLGITVPGLRSNGWIIGEVPAEAAAPVKRTRRSSAKGRLQVVQGGKDGEPEAGT